MQIEMKCHLYMILHLPMAVSSAAEPAPHSDLNFALKIDCHSGEKVHSMCVHHVLLVAKALCMPVAVDHIV